MRMSFDVPPLSSTPITQSDRRRAYGKAILEGDPGRGTWEDTERTARVWGIKGYGINDMTIQIPHGVANPDFSIWWVSKERGTVKAIPRMKAYGTYSRAFRSCRLIAMKYCWLPKMNTSSTASRSLSKSHTLSFWGLVDLLHFSKNDHWDGGWLKEKVVTIRPCGKPEYPPRMS